MMILHISFPSRQQPTCFLPLATVRALSASGVVCIRRSRYGCLKEASQRSRVAWADNEEVGGAGVCHCE
ncbi:hypothetical protein PRIPAC_91949 [Pristionchus pacificus]|nr:hypothetical protein PRIPAC_91949 [Pristionchus pacificus]